MSKVIAIDLEMNPVSGKIIQLGYIIGDLASGKVFTQYDIIVNPNEELQVIPENGIHISDYTGITQAMINNGTTLEIAYKVMCDDIKKYNCTTTCVQWGDGKGDNKGDHDHLRRELGLTWEQFIFRARTWDVKSYYQIYRAFKRQSVAAGLVKACESLGMTFVGRPHNAKCDAINTFLIFRKIGSKLIAFDQIEKSVNEAKKENY